MREFTGFGSDAGCQAALVHCGRGKAGLMGDVWGCDVNDGGDLLCTFEVSASADGAMLRWRAFRSRCHHLDVPLALWAPLRALKECRACAAAV